MKIYLAPLEGITGYIFRNAYHAVFEPADKYFTPFISTNQNHKLKSKELKDIMPEHNQGLYVVPQILSNNAADFIVTVEKLRQLGYLEININLGCPSGTVVAKRKGSGFLAYPEALLQFFEDIYADLPGDVMLSVKTRLGKERPEEFERILTIYNQYPLKELIIHPRVQTDFYKNEPDLNAFDLASEESQAPVCYNGNIFSKADYDNFWPHFAQTERIMLGRGIISNPFLIGEIRGHARPQREAAREALIELHSRLYHGYMQELSGDRNALFKMKEIWSYLIRQFPESDKGWKRIKKVQNRQDYEAVTAYLFETYQ